MERGRTGKRCDRSYRWSDTGEADQISNRIEGEADYYRCITRSPEGLVFFHLPSSLSSQQPTPLLFAPSSSLHINAYLQLFLCCCLLLSSISFYYFPFLHSFTSTYPYRFSLLFYFLSAFIFHPSLRCYLPLFKLIHVSSFFYSAVYYHLLPLISSLPSPSLYQLSLHFFLFFHPLSPSMDFHFPLSSFPSFHINLFRGIILCLPLHLVLAFPCHFSPNPITIREEGG